MDDWTHIPDRNAVSEPAPNHQGPMITLTSPGPSWMTFIGRSNQRQVRGGDHGGSAPAQADLLNVPSLENWRPVTPDRGFESRPSAAVPRRAGRRLTPRASVSTL